MPFQDGTERMRLRSLLLPKHWWVLLTFANILQASSVSQTDKKGKKYPICGPEGMRCLGKIKGEKQQLFFFFLENFWEIFLADEIVALQSSKRKIECDCMPNCDNTNFFVQSIVSLIKIQSQLMTFNYILTLSLVIVASDLEFGFWERISSGALSIIQSFNWNVNFCLESLMCSVWQWNYVRTSSFSVFFSHEQFTSVALVDYF